MTGDRTRSVRRWRAGLPGAYDEYTARYNQHSGRCGQGRQPRAPGFHAELLSVYLHGRCVVDLFARPPAQFVVEVGHDVVSSLRRRLARASYRWDLTEPSLMPSTCAISRTGRSSR
jgi:hypothetical protein